MIFSRLLSFILRGVELVCAVIVLGLMGWFLSEYHDKGVGPKGREIYTEVVAAFATFFALIWLLPFTFTFMHYPIDFLISFAWFASFGVLLNWMKKLGCYGTFNRRGHDHSGYCERWRATESFAFISAVAWLVSALVSMHIYHRVMGRERPVATDGTTRRRRWGRSRV